MAFSMLLLLSPYFLSFVILYKMDGFSGREWVGSPKHFFSLLRTESRDWLENVADKHTKMTLSIGVVVANGEMNVFQRKKNHFLRIIIIPQFTGTPPRHNEKMIRATNAPITMPCHAPSSRSVWISLLLRMCIGVRYHLNVSTMFSNLRVMAFCSISTPSMGIFRTCSLVKTFTNIFFVLLLWFCFTVIAFLPSSPHPPIHL